MSRGDTDMRFICAVVIPKLAEKPSLSVKVDPKTAEAYFECKFKQLDEAIVDYTVLWLVDGVGVYTDYISDARSSSLLTEKSYGPGGYNVQVTYLSEYSEKWRNK